MNFGKETETLEFKKSTGEAKEAVASISSILNKHGKGELYFGIKDDGSVSGQEIGKNTLRDVSKAISDGLKPQIFPTIDVVTISGQSCIRVVFEGSDPPYFAYDRAYMRVADEDKKMSPTELEDFYRRKIEQISTWDGAPSNADLKSIDANVLKKYINQANKVGRLDFPYTTKEEILTKLGLLTKDGLTNAAVAMFGKAPNLDLQMAIFATEAKLTFNDIARESGRIIDLVNIGELYIKKNIRYRAIIDGSQMPREEIPEVPLAAIREALLNSFCHRAYRVPQNNEVAIYSDRIEIYNPGTFPPGLTPQDYIYGNEKSVHRNPLLAQIMYYSKEIESFATGFKRIANACEEAGVKYDFINGKLGFTVIIYRPPIWTSDNMEKNLNGSHGVTGVTAEVTGVTAEVTEDEARVLKSISSNPKASYELLASELLLSRKTIGKHIKSLKEKGKLVRIGGATKEGYWKISD